VIELLHESILKKEKIGCETNQDKKGNDETEDNDIGFGDYLRERRKHRPDMSRSAMRGYMLKKLLWRV
jgi:hypothetical protein